GEGPPIFDTRVVAGPTNLLVETPGLGKAIAQTLGKANIVLMRGHGDTVVGPNVRLATFWAIYAEVNARQLAQAIAIGGPITFIEGEEQKLTHQNMATAYQRPWAMGKSEGRRAEGPAAGAAGTKHSRARPTVRFCVRPANDERRAPSLLRPQHVVRVPRSPIVRRRVVAPDLRPLRAVLVPRPRLEIAELLVVH